MRTFFSCALVSAIAVAQISDIYTQNDANITDFRDFQISNRNSTNITGVFDQIIQDTQNVQEVALDALHDTQEQIKYLSFIAAVNYINDVQTFEYLTINFGRSIQPSAKQVANATANLLAYQKQVALDVAKSVKADIAGSANVTNLMTDLSILENDQQQFLANITAIAKNVPGQVQQQQAQQEQFQAILKSYRDVYTANFMKNLKLNAELLKQDKQILDQDFSVFIGAASEIAQLACAQLEQNLADFKQAVQDLSQADPENAQNYAQGAVDLIQQKIANDAQVIRYLNSQLAESATQYAQNSQIDVQNLKQDRKTVLQSAYTNLISAYQVLSDEYAKNVQAHSAIWNQFVNNNTVYISGAVNSVKQYIQDNQTKNQDFALVLREALASIKSQYQAGGYQQQMQNLTQVEADAVKIFGGIAEQNAQFSARYFNEILQIQIRTFNGLLESASEDAFENTEEIKDAIEQVFYKYANQAAQIANNTQFSSSSISLQSSYEELSYFNELKQFVKSLPLLIENALADPATAVESLKADFFQFKYLTLSAALQLVGTVKLTVGEDMMAAKEEVKNRIRSIVFYYQPIVQQKAQEVLDQLIPLVQQKYQELGLTQAQIQEIKACFIAWYQENGNSIQNNSVEEIIVQYQSETSLMSTNPSDFLATRRANAQAQIKSIESELQAQFGSRFQPRQMFEDLQTQYRLIDANTVPQTIDWSSQQLTSFRSMIACNNDVTCMQNTSATSFMLVTEPTTVNSKAYAYTISAFAGVMIVGGALYMSNKKKVETQDDFLNALI